MIKLYVLYLFIGGYVFCLQLLEWIFFSHQGFIVNLTFYSSVILFSIASALSAFKVKAASIIGLLCLIGVAPFAIYWIFITDYTFVADQGMVFHMIMYCAIVLYFMAAFYSLKNIVNYKQPIDSKPIKKSVKLFMSLAPIITLSILLVLLYLLP